MEKGKISALQMAIIMNPTIVATAVLLVPAISVKHAKQDLWISPVWAAMVGCIVVLIAYKLNKLYPNESIVEYSNHIIGQFFGKIAGFIYVIFYFHINGIIIREYGEFVVGTFLPHTPMYVVLGSMVLVCASAVYGGVEVISRASQIMVPVVFLLFLLIAVMLLKDLEIKNIFPVMEDGIKPSFMGSIVPQGWFSEFFLIAFLLPFLKDRQKGLKWGMISVASALILLVLANVVVYMLFGELTGVFTYPLMVAVRYISIADFLEHLEAIVMAIWVTGTFIKIAVFYYVNVISTAQWLNLSDYRPIVLPIGIILLSFSFWSAHNLQEMSHFLSTIAPFYFLTLQLVFPLFLLCIACIQERIQQKRGKTK
ncbi:MAG TPA: endospore germination permease [Bacillus bacterium]|nr:endospore germination permease [Bacillus sp. (in: firmicutes)]